MPPGTTPTAASASFDSAWPVQSSEASAWNASRAIPNWSNSDANGRAPRLSRASANTWMKPALAAGRLKDTGTLPGSTPIAAENRNVLTFSAPVVVVRRSPPATRRSPADGCPPPPPSVQSLNCTGLCELAPSL